MSVHELLFPVVSIFQLNFCFPQYVRRVSINLFCSHTLQVGGERVILKKFCSHFKIRFQASCCDLAGKSNSKTKELRVYSRSRGVSSKIFLT